jgi:hypothetical protein
MRALPILILAIASLPAFTQTPQTVGISGMVVDDSGVPVAGTKVAYNNSPTTVRDRVGHMKVIGPMVSSMLVTAKDGTFSVTGLPPGVYWLCAEALLPTQIRSCDWGFGGTKLDLTSETSASNVKLQLHAGVSVTFEVNDIHNQVRDYAADLTQPATPGNFRIFVVDGTWMKPAKPVTVNGAIRQYAVTVPAARAVRLLVDTKLMVLNQAQTTVAADRLDDTIATSAGQPTTYKITIP